MSSCTTQTTQTTYGNRAIQKVNFAPDNFQHLTGDYLNISITEIAMQKMIARMEQKPQARGVRISVLTKGCSGLSYKMEYAESMINITEKDEVIKLDKISIYIDPKSSLFLFNLQIDYENDGIQSGFKFNNPTSKGSCGCGESFFV